MSMRGWPHWLQMLYLLLGASIMALASRAERTKRSYVRDEMRHQVQLSSDEVFLGLRPVAGEEE